MAPCHTIKVLAAACSRNPTSTSELLDFASAYDESFVQDVRIGLAMFDEHNTSDDLDAFHRWRRETSNRTLPPFRVLDEATRNESLRPVAAGLVLFNLNDRRIVQIQNSYADVQRSDRGRVRRDGEPTRMLYRYRLPESWSIVP
jgi:hypothetical protein